MDPGAGQPSGAIECRACGRELERWFARCPHCDSWLVRSAANPAVSRAPARALRVVPDQQPRAPRPERVTPRSAEVDAGPRAPPESTAVSIVDVDVSDQANRWPTGVEPLDRVLGGGGIVVGTLVILGGEPGIGKSTLLMQVAATAACGGARLYATGEESTAQVAMRAHRIGAAIPEIRIVRETELEAILWHARNESARIVVVDSVHTIHSATVDAPIGSDYQVKRCGQILMEFAKDTGTSVVLISHVNKDGAISGPKNFEHVGDVTLMFEMSELGDPWRTLRSTKNRFGSTTEVGMFEMGDRGLAACDAAAARESRAESDGALLPVAQELLQRYLELGGEVDAGLRDRIAGRLDLTPRGSR